MKRIIITGTGNYWTRNGTMVHIGHIDNGQAYATWHPDAVWNLDGTHNHSAYDIVCKAD